MLLAPSVIDVALGVFFIGMIPLRRWHAKAGYRLGLWQIAVAGAGIGFLTGLVLSTGPLSVPVLTSYGLTGGALLATVSAASLALFVSKVAAFRQLGALPGDMHFRWELWALR